MKTVLGDNDFAPVLEQLSAANKRFSQAFPGDHPGRQPVHTVYGGAHIFKSDYVKKLGAMALRSLDEYAPDGKTFGEALGISAEISATVYARVREKLRREPVEDFRIDFEDGFGNRPDVEEDEAAAAAALELARGFKDNVLSPYCGIRIKPLTDELKRRSLRTLDIFISTLLETTAGKLPENFVVTLPKLTVAEQAGALAEILSCLERRLGISTNTLKLEVMIETPQSVFLEGEPAAPVFLRNAKGRCIAAHFGTYDYTASTNLTASNQVMDHPSCDFAREVMKVSLAGSGVWISDGATNVMPVGPHRSAPGEAALSKQQLEENRQVVHRAWKLAYDHIRHSLKHAFYQGWDLHPAQLPVRYGAVYAFFLEGFAAASERLRNFVEKSAQATLLGSVFDDAATGQGLLNYFLRALNCRAITEEEALATGLTLDEIRGRSFLKILENRRGKS